jgi:hypothetical protein
VSQELPKWLAGDTQFNKELWIDEACDLANLILESPLASEHDYEGGKVVDADWSESDPFRPDTDKLLSFELARWPIEGGFGYRLDARSHATGVVDKYLFSTENRRHFEFGVEVPEGFDVNTIKEPSFQEAAEAVTRYLMMAPVDREDFILAAAHDGPDEVKRELTIEAIAADPLAERAVKYQSGNDQASVNEYNATVAILSLGYKVDGELARRAIKRRADQMEQEKHGQA